MYGSNIVDRDFDIGEQESAAEALEVRARWIDILPLLPRNRIPVPVPRNIHPSHSGLSRSYRAYTDFLDPPSFAPFLSRHPSNTCRSIESRCPLGESEWCASCTRAAPSRFSPFLPSPVPPLLTPTCGPRTTSTNASFWMHAASSLTMPPPTRILVISPTTVQGTTAYRSLPPIPMPTRMHCPQESTSTTPAGLRLRPRRSPTIPSSPTSSRGSSPRRSPTTGSDQSPARRRWRSSGANTQGAGRRTWSPP